MPSIKQHSNTRSIIIIVYYIKYKNTNFKYKNIIVLPGLPGGLKEF